MSGEFDAILDGRPASITRHPVTARVVRSDDTGVWAVPLGGDTRHPTGPCRGATRLTGALVRERLPVGVVVLLVWTQERPWVAGWEENP